MGCTEGGAILAKTQGKWFCKVRRVGKLRLREAELLPMVLQQASSTPGTGRWPHLLWVPHREKASTH